MTNNNKISRPRIPTGAHLKSPRLGYTHHGLYIGRDQVIHYSGLADGLSAAPVTISSLTDFAAGHSFRIVPHPDARHSGKAAVQRALSRLGEDKYNLVFNNCEQFVNWAIDGNHHSPQVETAAHLAADLVARKNPQLGDLIRSGVKVAQVVLNAK